MAHTRLVIQTTPKQHERLIDELSNHDYYVEGELFRGYTRPVFNEVKLYDIRMYKEGIPQLLRDLNAIDVANLSQDNHRHHIPFHKVVKWFISLFRKLTGHSVPEYRHLSGNKPLPRGWHYCFVIGEYPDPVSETGKEEL